MALEREIWINSIIEGLYKDNTFAAQSVDHSPWINNRTVHVPNAGTGPNVVKNRSTLPATITTRTDIDLKYDIAEFTTDPIRIPHAETVELSYNKRESVISVSRDTLTEKVHDSLLADWIAGAASITAGTDVKATIKAIKKQFDKDNVYQEGRFLLLDADEYNDLVELLTDSAMAHFLSGASPEAGTVGKYLGFNIYTRSTLNGVKSGLAWHRNAVSRALGETEMFDDQGSPTYYGDIVSFLVRSGGKVIRYDGKGVLTY